MIQKEWKIRAGFVGFGEVNTPREFIDNRCRIAADELKKRGLQSQTEAKFENTINRMTAEANPRQIERVVRGAKFPLELIYNAEKEEEIIEDIRLLKEAMQLLTYDYLGGNGSRGYGKVKFWDLEAEVVVGEVDATILEKCNEILKKE